MWQERGSLVSTEIFVRFLSERHTNLWLLPLDRSLRSSSLRHGRWTGGRPTLQFLLHFFLLFIAGSFIYMHGRGSLLIIKIQINEQTHE